VRAGKALIALVFLALPAWAQAPEPQPNSVLLVARPELADPNFRETVVLVTQVADASTIGVILNRPTPQRHTQTAEPVFAGGPVMRGVLVALFRAQTAPAAAFPVLKGVYLGMHPDNIKRVLESGAQRRLYSGFSGWMPNQLQSEMQRDGWYVLPATEELLFRDDTSGMWRELLEKARGARTQRNDGQNATLAALPDKDNMAY